MGIGFYLFSNAEIVGVKPSYLLKTSQHHVRKILITLVKIYKLLSCNQEITYFLLNGMQKYFHKRLRCLNTKFISKYRVESILFKNINFII